MLSTALGAVIFALIEIEIEGEHGWAVNTKTAPITADFFYFSYYHLFMLSYVIVSVKADNDTYVKWLFHIIAWLAIEGETFQYTFIYSIIY